MTGVIGIIGTLISPALAGASLRWTVSREALENASAVCFVAGLGLVGAALPCLC
ncbi:MAG: hypothetical protein ACTHLY_03110 [Pseudolabrys sp.]